MHNLVFELMIYIFPLITYDIGQSSVQLLFEYRIDQYDGYLQGHCVIIPFVFFVLILGLLLLFFFKS